MEDIYIDLRTQNEWIQRIFVDKDIVSLEEILEKVSDLDSELNNVKADFEIFKQDVEDNYKRIPVKDQLGIYDSDFI